MSQENIAYERELGNINIRGKRGKKNVHFGIEPMAAEVDRGKIDDSKAPDLFLDPNLPNIDVVGQDMSARPQATQDTISKAHSIYDIEKEKQAVRDKEKAEANELGRLYVEGRRYGLDKLMEEVNAAPHVNKPVVDEDVPIIDTTFEKEEPLPNGLATEKKEEEKKESNPLDDYVQLVNDLWTKEDEEAAKKKQKAAQWILAAQMLGDSIGALSNVYWTGKGANAQKLEPGAQKAAAATYQLEQDIRNAREKAAKAKLDATLKKHEMEMQRERYASEQAESRRRYDEGMAYRRERDAIVDAREKELMEFRRQQENRIAKSSRGASTSTKDVEPIEFTLGDGETIGIDKFNKDKLNRLYRSLPEDVRSAIENEEVYSNNGLSMGTRKRKVTDDDRLQAIYDNLDNPEVANAIRRLAGVEAAAANTEAPKSVVVKDAHGYEYSVNPDDFPALGMPSFMQTDEAKRHINGIEISTGKEKDGRIKVDLSKL